ncbi:MAG: hypothetical protein HYV18_05630 [Gammaproteobacteria bacterium]|nr:hypothetical protein [Gammaproteobacteria bacterium]
MSNWSKPLPDAEAANARLWEVPDLGPPKNTLHTARHLEELEASAYEEGLAEGRKAGLEAGLKDAQALIDRLRGLIQNFSKPLDQLDAEVERMLVELMLKLARELAAREFKRDPAAVAGVVREAIRAITPAPREVRVFLHPDDAAALQEIFAQQTNPYCHLVADPALQIGDCRVTTDTSTVNARLDARVAELAQSLFGEG